jgi:KDO2-lipid IV(A) lauroyltransferase
MTLLSRLAAKTGATVLMSYAERLPNGQGYHLHFQPAPQCVADKDVSTAATCLNLAVEQCALQVPAQYQWAYKRFKTRPEGGKKVY